MQNQFNIDENLNSIVILDLIKKKKKHNCLKCEKSFGSKIKLRRHQRVHRVENIFPCNYPNCNEVFSKLVLLNLHHRTHVNKMNKIRKDINHTNAANAREFS
jgi:uncharacterized Zn-finger protein